MLPLTPSPSLCSGQALREAGRGRRRGLSYTKEEGSKKDKERHGSL
jgi:hypothetical protein